MKSMLGMCFNWKVLAGLAAVGVTIAIVSPGSVAAALPLLLLAACPLSMVLMFFTMGKMGKKEPGHGEETVPTQPAKAINARLAALDLERAELQAKLEDGEETAIHHGTSAGLKA